MLTLDLDSRELMARAQQGDSAAFGELARQTRPYIWEIIRRRTITDCGTVDDLTQETLLRAWRYLDHYRSDGPTVARWLAAIARHVVVDHHRARTAGTRCTESLFGMAEDLPQTAGRDPYRAVDDHDQVQHVLGALSDDHRQVLELHYLTGLSSPEIAALTGLPTPTVKTRLHYARQAAHRLAAANV